MRVLALLFLVACGAACRSNGDAALQAPVDPIASAPEVRPPFKVRDGEQGLFITWYDGQGAPHVAEKLGDVPAEHRQRVRVDSLMVAPDQRLDAAFVYVADLSKQSPQGEPVVRKVLREAFEASVVPKAAEVQGGPTTLAAGGKDVVLYGASWCGACKQARRFFTQKGIPFVDRDIEREPDARTEMLAKARAQGVSTNGIPVIDVRGVMMGGFDPRRIESALAAN
jgi:mycoredoxin